MNGKVQGIIVCGVMAASLAGVLVFLNATDGGKQEDSSSKISDYSEVPMEHYVVLEKDSSEIIAIRAENEEGGFTLDKPSSGKSSWIVEEISTINQNTSLKESLISGCGGMEASKIAEENAEDLAKYGLAEPAASFEVSYADGSSKTVLIGDEAPGTRYSYVKTTDSSAVYMMLTSRLSDLMGSAYRFAELKLIPKPVNNEDWPEYGRETITRSDWEHEVVFENDPNTAQSMLSSQVITEPIFAYLNITGSSDVTHGMWGLSAWSCVAASPDEELLEEYGINEPRCVVSLKGDGYDYTLRVGNEAFEPAEDENAAPVKLGYYCTLEGVAGCNAVYIMTDTYLPWVSFRIEDVISNLITTNYLVDLAQMSIETDGELTVYEMTTNGGSTDLDENGKAADLQSVKLNDKELDIGEYKSLYEFIMSCPTNELCFDDPEGEPELTIKQTRKDGGEDVVEMYKDTARRYIVKLNGKASYRIQSTWVDSLKSNMESLKNGGKISSNY